ncbi:MAG: GNAT family N-acetyltransferase [Pseudomonadota bacterium]
MHCRPCEIADLPALIALYAHLSPEDPPTDIDIAQANLRAMGTYTGSAVLLGEVEHTLITSCTCIVVPNLSRRGRPYALLENVVTHRDYRCQGFGTQILRYAIDGAFAQGCYKVMLLTGTKKQSTLDFYLKAGFQQTKTGFQIRA